MRVETAAHATCHELVGVVATVNTVFLKTPEDAILLRKTRSKLTGDLLEVLYSRHTHSGIGRSRIFLTSSAVSEIVAGLFVKHALRGAA